MNFDRPSTRNSQAGRASANSSDSGTLSYLQSGKLPIESTRTELIWGCVKPGKTISQEFILRNRCSQRVRLQATINGQGFKFIKDQTETGTTLSLMLHSLESRTITVNFSPNSKGAAAAKLMFLPIENDAIHSKRQM
ncbi:spindle defective 2 [Carabus blaptoides fortunei]